MTMPETAVNKDYGPVLGEHTDTVLEALGYSVAERVQLRQAGTVA